MPRKDAVSGPISAQAQQDLVSMGIENFELPKSIVTKIARSSIPENSKLQKDTILSLVKGSTVFVNYLAATSVTAHYLLEHKSISASDVLKALELIEFGDLVQVLQAELQTFRDLAKADKGGKKATSGMQSASVGPTKKSAPVASDGVSVSAPPTTKSKGKEKETVATTASSLKTFIISNPSASSTGIPMDVENDSDSSMREDDDAAVSEPGEYDEEHAEVVNDVDPIGLSLTS